MFEKINIHSSVSVYNQIENQIQFAVASGKLKPGDRLPSIRELSETLGINPNTVAKAYRDLEVMGIVYSRRGMGVFINKGVEARIREDCRKRIVGRLHEVVSEAKAAGMSARDVKEISGASYASGGDPYGEVPGAVMAAGKKLGGKKK